mgnify:CR=1 FL=1
MQVILLAPVSGLGKIGQTVDVRNGYARNFLLPQRKALTATKANLAKFEAQRAALEAEQAKLKAAAETFATKFNGIKISLERQASETGQLFGSVKPLDIVRGLASQSLSIEKAQVLIGDPIKMVGEHTVRLELHPDVVVELPVEVKRQATTA